VIDRDRSAARRGRARRAALALWLGLLAGLATPAASRADAGSDAGASATEARVRDPDPWEPMNRGIFWFNEKTDIYFVAPVARGWRFVVPGFARKGIENFNGLLVMPVVLGNGILQLKPKNAIQDVGRIVYNATFGIAGFIDVATMIGIPQNDEDFGQTLGYWGAPTGPYLVLPIFGPSNVRDGIGRLGDTAGTFYFSFLPFWATFIVRGVELVNLRARFLEEVEENRRESFDYYVFLRDAYLQNRASRIGRARGDGEPGATGADDLYYYDDEEWEVDQWREQEPDRDDADDPGDGSEPVPDGTGHGD
jgi:phospholipid-binding lipoprotein MlaA